MQKVSVIMPVYNGELYIERAIGSLLSQSFQDWELIVVDDGSTDATPQILQRYTDTRIRIFSQKNRGEAGARNTGLANMAGEYMAFLDADDEYLPGALDSLVSYLDNHLQYTVVFSDGYICNHQDKQLMRLTEVRPGIYTGNILDQLVLSPSVITVPVCTLTRASKVRENNLHFDEENNLIGTDWDFWIQLAVHAKFGYLDRLTCKYRIHTANITRTTGSEKRRKDQIYCRMKILNSKWFYDLSPNTRELFFFDLLTVLLSGDMERQNVILHSNQFASISSSKQADFWRRVGIDALQSGCSSDQVRYYFLESRKLNPGDPKTWVLLKGLKVGRPIVLTFLNIWHWLLMIRKKITGRSGSGRLQRLLLGAS